MTAEKLTAKRVLLPLILVAFALIYIGVNVSWLAFLPTCGLVILLGIIYWEKREHEKKPRRHIMLSVLAMMTLLTPLAVPTVSATLYDGHSECTWTVPPHFLDVAVDTEADIITFMWEGSDYIIIPVPAVRNPLTPCWVVSDDKGYYNFHGIVNGTLPHSGSHTIEGYTHTGTWLTVEVTWQYSNSVVFITVPLKVNIYLAEESSGDGDGHGGGTPWVYISPDSTNQK